MEKRPGAPMPEVKAVQPNPTRRYGELSEFIHDLRQPNPAFLRKHRAPLLERNPILFWQGLCLVLLITTLLLLFSHPLTTGAVAPESAGPYHPSPAVPTTHTHDHHDASSQGFTTTTTNAGETR